MEEERKLEAGKFEEGESEVGTVRAGKGISRQVVRYGELESGADGKKDEVENGVVARKG